MGINALPGDIVIRKNRDPKLNDIVEIGAKGADGYFTQAVKVEKINIKEGTLFVKNLLEPDNKGTIAASNIICVVDKVIPYEDRDWKKTVQVLGIDYDITDIEKWTEKSIEYVKANEFYDKANTLKKLENRLKVLRTK